VVVARGIKGKKKKDAAHRGTVVLKQGVCREWFFFAKKNWGGKKWNSTATEKLRQKGGEGEKNAKTKKKRPSKIRGLKLEGGNGPARLLWERGEREGSSSGRKGGLRKEKKKWKTHEQRADRGRGKRTSRGVTTREGEATTSKRKGSGGVGTRFSKNTEGRNYGPIKAKRSVAKGKFKGLKSTTGILNERGW